MQEIFLLLAMFIILVLGIAVMTATMHFTQKPVKKINLIVSRTKLSQVLQTYCGEELQKEIVDCDSVSKILAEHQNEFLIREVHDGRTNL